MRTSGRTNSTPGWPNIQRPGPGEEQRKEKTCKKRSQTEGRPGGGAKKRKNMQKEEPDRGQAQGRSKEKKKHAKRGAKGLGALSLSSLHVFWVVTPSCIKDVFSFIF